MHYTANAFIITLTYVISSNMTTLISVSQLTELSQLTYTKLPTN